MQIIHAKPQQINNSAKHKRYALGNFDGLHLGHQAVIASAGTEQQKPSVLTFSPHPRQFFSKYSAPFLLLDEKEQSECFARHGVEALTYLIFDQSLVDMPPETFIDEILLKQLEVQHISVGENFRFGHDRRGDATFIQDRLAAHGISTHIIPLLEIDGAPVSSSRIREALRVGRPDIAKNLLGRAHVIRGIVEQGDQRGRDLGYPTANLNPKTVMLPKFGIYATRVEILTGIHKGQYIGASSLGVRPSFGVNKPNFETHILDFHGDIYSEDIRVSLFHYLRGEEKFDSLDALIAQMNKDVDFCREYFIT